MKVPILLPNIINHPFTYESKIDLKVGDYVVVPFGKAKIVQEGNILTIITWGAMVQKCIESVKACELEQGMVEIDDLRTLNPLDHETISSSVVKTGKALVVHEDNLTNGPGAEIAALIAENNFEYLDGPVIRVGSADAHVPYNWYLEEKVLVQNSDIQNALIELLEY